MTDTDRMVVWLREAMNAAELAAQKAAELCGCHSPAPRWLFGDETTDGRILVVDDPHPALKRKISRRWNGSYEGLFMAEHIVRHDPEAVLRRIAADRKLLGLHTTPHTVVELVVEPVGELFCGECDGPCTHKGEAQCEICGQDGCDTMRLLAEGWGWTEETT